MQWTLHITYGMKSYFLKATQEYRSNQIMRIRVAGTKRSFLLENNYPILHGTRSKKGMQWKIRERYTDHATPANTRLILDIMVQLEYFIKRDFLI